MIDETTPKQLLAKFHVKPENLPYFDGKGSEREREIRKSIDNLISGKDRYASEKLILYFKDYLLKWLSFLTNQYPFTDNYFDQFLRFRGFAPMPGDLANRRRIIINNLKSYQKEELFDEICLAFLEGAKQSGNPTSDMPILLAVRVFHLTKDPLTFGRKCLPVSSILAYDRKVITMDELITERSVVRSTKTKSGDEIVDDFFFELQKCRKDGIGISGSVGKVVSNIYDLIEAVQDDTGLITLSLNRSWIDGVTVGLGNISAFSVLTPQERELVLRFFLIKQSCAVICKEMSIANPQLVYNRIHVIRKKLLEELNLGLDKSID